MAEHEIRTWLCGRWDSLGGYVRFWFDGPGFSWRLSPRFRLKRLPPNPR